MGLSVPEYFGSNPLSLTEDMQWLGNIVNTLGQTGMAVGAFTALFLDNTIPGTNGERGLTSFAPEGMGPPAEEDSTFGGHVTVVMAVVLLVLGALIYNLPEPEEAPAAGEDIVEVADDDGPGNTAAQEEGSEASVSTED